MRTYLQFIRPNFRNLIILDAFFLLLVVVKLFFVKDLNWFFVFSSYITYWVVTTIGYLWSKYKDYVD